MHPVIYLNRTMVEATKARVAPVSSAMLYGRGVFTTLAVYNSQPFLWSRHWERLSAHAAKLAVDLTGLSEKNVGEALRKLIAVNQVEDGRARVILLARSGRDVWKTRTTGSKNTDLIIMTGEAHKKPVSGLSIAVSPYRVSTLSPTTGIKSLNYLDHVLSWEEAQTRDFDEAVMLNERGEIVSGTLANIFWVTNGTVHTPALSTGAMAGITRESVIDIANKHFIPVVEGVYEMPDLTEADEIFLTSSGLGLAQVTTFDFRRYNAAAGKLVSTLTTAFSKLIS
ncbi:MAG TPA: aminotransferase class IV [Pyrinomonadaceae bacterium]|nr:aminotransferase class IV [Pyrinomonadaceae bacterium]